MVPKSQQLDYIIFSASLSTATQTENIIRTSEMIQALTKRGIQYKIIEGSYKGARETSFIAVYDPVIEDLAASFEQESVLILGPFDDAKLVYLNTEQTVNLGKLVKVDEATAKASESWSFRPDLNQYYITRG